MSTSSVEPQKIKIHDIYNFVVKTDSWAGIRNIAS